MPYSDMPLAQLRSYRGEVERPAEFDEFWQGNLAAARAARFAPRLERVDSPLRLVETYDVTFSGFGGQPIRAWLHRPAGAADCPVLVRYVGYNCGRGLPHAVSPFVLAGYAVLCMDNRGQGVSAALVGDTPDEGAMRHLGNVIRGIESRETYYYRRLYTDAALAVDAARDLPGIDPNRVGVSGVSQGGGIALAVAGLVPDLSAAMIDVPFLSDIPRAIALSPEPLYVEFTTLFGSYPGSVDEIFRTLAFFDGTGFAVTATAPALFSVGLLDAVCPPSTVYASYNNYAGAKTIQEYPFNAHEGGSFNHEAMQLDWLPRLIPV